jgi:AsmA protein
VALAVNAAVPDLSAFSPLAGQTLPAWKNIQLQATVIDPGGLGLRDALGLDGLTVTMDDADFGGAASLYLSAQPRLQLALNFTRLNLDALLAAMPKPAGQTGQAPQPPATTGADANALPDIALPLKALRSASADVQVSADTLIWKQATYTALQGHAVLANGVLTINPVTGQIPGGSVMAAATLDSTKNPAAEAANLSAPALALSPFLKAFGLSDSAEGTVTAKLVATSHGNDLQAIAGGLDGQFGLAMVNGIVDGSVMDHLFGTVLHTVGLPASVVGAQGPVAVRCMAFRVDAQNGVGTIKTLTLDSSRLLVQGGGSVDFGNETLNMIVRPQLDFAGTEVGVPVRIGGSFSAPTTSVAPASAVQAAAQAAIGLPLNIAQETLGANTIFGKAASMLGAGQPGDVCPAALSLGRLGQPGPSAPPVSANPASTPAQGKLNGPRNLLDTLFGK